MRKAILIAAQLLFAISAFASSYYSSRLDDPRAVYLTRAAFGVKGDGIADDTAAMQRAINEIQEKHNQGILFVPAGDYRLTKTIYVWPGIRLIGYGKTRPLFTLGKNTPGFQKDPAYLVFFAGDRPAAGENPEDANPGTFYSAISNIDFEIQEGNPAAVAVRARYAQHCFLSHIDFRIGSGLAGIHDGGNVAQDVHFYGGQYGIWTRKPSPGWQFTVIDATFEGQREAAIREHEAGLTLIRPSFKNVPTAVSIDPQYAEELWIKDARVENVSGPAFVISNEKNARTEINMENVVCNHVSQFAAYRESGRQVAGPAAMYEVKTFSHGLYYDDIGSIPEIRDVFEAAPLETLTVPVKSDIFDLPPMDTWVNIRALGVLGDGVTDDTAAFQKAIAAHRTIYLPSGQYRVTDTITLKPDTVLIGLHPSVTRIFLADSTPAFQGVGSSKALLETPSGGTNIVTGIGLYTNGINPRAVAAKWMAGTNSMMNDVRFLGGHGTIDPNGSAKESHKVWREIYNDTHTGDSNPKRRWDAQYPSLWIGGGGTFVNIWTPSTFAQAGMLISNTSVGGRIYELSSEHHVRNEIILDHASNWQIYALQTEEERGESGFALPLDIRDSSNIMIANLHMYRVVSSYQPFPRAISIARSSNIQFRNVHCYSDSRVSFDSAVFDQSNNIEIRQREFAWLAVSGHSMQRQSMAREKVVGPQETIQSVATGFFNISGGAVDASGNIYFVDAHRKTIYRWSPSRRELSKVRDNPLDPVSLFFDKVGNLIVISSEGDGTVYSFKPDDPSDDIKLLGPVAAEPRANMTLVLPVDYWRNENDFVKAMPVKQPYQYLSPDGTTFLPAGKSFVTGELYYGSKLNNELRAFGMAPAFSGQPFYVSDESEQKTYAATVGSDGAITDLRLFAERGGEGVAVDDEGDVYIAAGQIYVYNAAGEWIDTIEVPERPAQLLFGGQDRHTLYIAARTSLYAIRTVNGGH